MDEVPWYTLHSFCKDHDTQCTQITNPMVHNALQMQRQWYTMHSKCRDNGTQCTQITNPVRHNALKLQSQCVHNALKLQSPYYTMHSNYTKPIQRQIVPGLPQSWKKSWKKKIFSRSWKSQGILFTVSENEQLWKGQGKSVSSGNFLLLEYTYSSQICTKHHMP